MTNPSSRDLIAKSEGGLIPHTHTLTIKGEILENPPANEITLETNKAYSLVYRHSHKVKITSDQLKKIRKGETVIVRDTDKGRHSFTISMTTPKASE